MALTNTAIQNAKHGDKAKKLFDGGGLYLEISPKGGKWWRLKYRFGGKEKRLSLGVYPEISLKDARVRRDSARKLLANDVDPSVHRKAPWRSNRLFQSITGDQFGRQSRNTTITYCHQCRRDLTAEMLEACR